MNRVERASRLSQLVTRVDQGLAGVPGAEAALQEILTERLYPGNDFAAWCDKQWPRHKDTIRKLLGVADVQVGIAFPDVVEGEPEPTPLPTPTDAQARELARLPEAHQRPTWEAVVRGSQTSGLRVTASLVKEAVNQTLAALDFKEPTPAEAKAARESLAQRSRRELDTAAVKFFVKRIRILEGQVKDLADHRQARARAWLSDGRKLFDV